MSDALILLTSEPVLTSLPGLLALAAASVLRRPRTDGSPSLPPVPAPENGRAGWLMRGAPVGRVGPLAR